MRTFTTLKQINPDEDEKPAKEGPQSPVMDLPKIQKPYRFVIQEHQRGKSSHLDFRLEVNDHLVGFTLDDPGRVGAPLRFKNDANYSSKNKVLCQLKARQPKEWLKTEGTIEPGKVGATKFLPARFKEIDSGTYEMGAQKPYLLECFLKGKVYKGRFVFRKLPRSGKWEKAGKKALVWFTWKPMDQTPYTLSSRAIRVGWTPPKGRSALPKEWEDKIPTELRWWEKGWTGEQALSTIKEARKVLLKRKVIQLSQLNFCLQRHSWKGQEVIRKMPVEHWDLRFSNGVYFNLDANPISQKKGITAVKKICKNIDKWIKFEGKIPPGEEGNPNKEIPAFVEILDKGKAEIIEQTERFISFKLFGTKLKGFWIAKSHDGTWTVETSQAGAKPKKLQSIELSDAQIGMIFRLSNSELSLAQIADESGCSKSSVVVWQKKMGLR